MTLTDIENELDIKGPKLMGIHDALKKTVREAYDSNSDAMDIALKMMGLFGQYLSCMRKLIVIKENALKERDSEAFSRELMIKFSVAIDIALETQVHFMMYCNLSQVQENSEVNSTSLSSFYFDAIRKEMEVSLSILSCIQKYEHNNTKEEAKHIRNVYNKLLVLGEDLINAKQIYLSARWKSDQHFAPSNVFLNNVIENLSQKRSELMSDIQLINRETSENNAENHEELSPGQSLTPKVANSNIPTKDGNTVSPEMGLHLHDVIPTISRGLRQKNMSLFNDYIYERRHESASSQHEFDKHFGLIVAPT